MGTPPITAVGRGLAAELQDDEKKVGELYNEYLSALAKYQVAAKKYAAVRDAVIEELGFDPYSVGDFPWKNYNPYFPSGREVGEFRFVYMKPGNAVITVLKSAEKPMTLGEIQETLGYGKAGLTLRSVNAVLMNTAGIKKLKGDVYVFEEPAEDLPF